MVNEDAEMQSSDKNVLQLLDSTDSYLLLMNSLSSSLRQGWLELASARHSMGASRISSALFDLKSHSAATTLQLNHQDAGPELEKSHFSLCKWASSESSKSCSEEAKFEEDKLLQKKSISPKSLNQEGLSNSVQEEVSEAQETTESPRTLEDQARKERLKSLSMFGVLVCPKLRAAQSSFETALETLVEVANKRADLLNAYDQVREHMKTTK
ncbi:putative 60S ribosomal protein L34-like isoform 1 [Capsicum annuum]|uniref:coiled-coil domain-containing protein 115 isoform X2 n=1 Tax=Capsicum annuum TaxID=4072 RepID=UPI0007BFA34E|nr:coiled-coil domain-containing protein 115 isoform X2 [Capsicum annuum]KAF3635557.1 putative 60S ribosomal protein L34-like isoform 1 [Capsicum annuum]